MKKSTTRLALLSYLLLWPFSSALSESSKTSKENHPDATILLKESDRYRGASNEGLSWNVKVDTAEDGDKSSRSYLIKAKNLNALAECQTPTKSKGEIVLFNDRTIWFFKPGVRKPLAISPRQRVSGQAATGDIASTNYARDYSATYVSTETIEGDEAHLLSLKAIGKNVTYDAIKYWVSAKSNLALKAEFMTVSGQVFKTAIFRYENSMTTSKGKIPFISKMIIRDAQNPENMTTLEYDSPQEVSLDDSIFNINNIVR